MSKSATQLGKDLGLTGQEMNQLLKSEGMLSGEPNGWSITEKGKAYASQNDHHAGLGGSPWYNRDWTTTSWDESVLDTVIRVFAHMNPSFA